ncbi:MAG: hypothetical protein IOD12_03450 [Silvanigrellales bacterium]|nr:hypothetical protein [Silvanigrellales bacterium]
MYPELLDLCTALTTKPQWTERMTFASGAVVRVAQETVPNDKTYATGFVFDKSGLVLTNRHTVEVCVQSLSPEKRKALIAGQETPCPPRSLTVESFDILSCPQTGRKISGMLQSTSSQVWEVSLVALGSDENVTTGTSKDVALLRLKGPWKGPVLSLADASPDVSPAGSPEASAGWVQLGYPSAPRFNAEELKLRRKEVAKAAATATGVRLTCAQQALEALETFEKQLVAPKGGFVPANQTLRFAFPRRLLWTETFTSRLAQAVSSKAIDASVQQTLAKELCLVVGGDTSEPGSPQMEGLSLMLKTLQGVASPTERADALKVATFLKSRMGNDAPGTFPITSAAGGGFSGSPLLDVSGRVVGMFAAATKTNISYVEFVPIDGLVVDAAALHRFVAPFVKAAR